MNPSETDTPLSLFKRSIPTLKNNRSFILFFIGLSTLIMLASFKWRQGLVEQDAQFIQVAFELIFLFLNILFIHGLNCRRRGFSIHTSKLIGDGLLLMPGYILQTIFWFLCVLLGGLFFIIPGILAFFVFYFAPFIAVIYPDYEGRVFPLTKELFWPHIVRSAVIIIVISLVVYAPSLLHLLFMGQLESELSWLIIPLNCTLFFLCEVMLFEFVYGFVARKREEIKSSKEDPQRNSHV